MDLNQIRQDTPGLDNKLFVNSAGSSLSPISVNETITAYLKAESEWGGYKLADMREQEINQFYSEAATLLHTNAKNIAFAHDATDAYIKALTSIPFKAGDVILTTDDDYSSSYIQFASLAERNGIVIQRIKNLENSDLDLVDFQEKLITYKPKLVSVTHIPTNSGLIQDVEAIGDICKSNDIPYLVDACQSVGQIDVDVQKIKCDFLTATGRKFLRGPRGTGLLYVSDKILNSDIKPFMPDTGSAKWTDTLDYELIETARRFETWERSYALVAGMTETFRYANTIGISQIEQYNIKIMNKLRANLSAVPGVTLYDFGSKKSNILTFRKTGKSKDQTINAFDSHQIFYSVSHEHNALIDFRKKGLDWVIRLSPHYFNSETEMDQLAEIIEGI